MDLDDVMSQLQGSGLNASSIRSLLSRMGAGRQAPAMSGVDINTVAGRHVDAGGAPEPAGMMIGGSGGQGGRRLVNGVWVDPEDDRQRAQQAWDDMQRREAIRRRELDEQFARESTDRARVAREWVDREDMLRREDALLRERDRPTQPPSRSERAQAQWPSMAALLSRR